MEVTSTLSGCRMWYESFSRYLFCFLS